MSVFIYVDTERGLRPTLNFNDKAFTLCTVKKPEWTQMPLNRHPAPPLTPSPPTCRRSRHQQTLLIKTISSVVRPLSLHRVQAFPSRHREHPPRTNTLQAYIDAA